MCSMAGAYIGITVHVGMQSWFFNIMLGTASPAGDSSCRLLPGDQLMPGLLFCCCSAVANDIFTYPIWLMSVNTPHSDAVDKLLCNDTACPACVQLDVS